MKITTQLCHKLSDRGLLSVIQNLSGDKAGDGVSLYTEDEINLAQRELTYRKSHREDRKKKLRLRHSGKASY